MSEPLSLMYGIDLQARCLVGLPAEQERTLFLVGTLSLKQENQVCVLEVDDDWVQISKRSYAHPAGEIWHLASSPLDSTILATCYSSWTGKLESGVGVWKIDAESGSLTSKAVFSPAADSKRCSCFEFHPDGTKAAIVVDRALHIADVDDSLQVINSLTIDAKSKIRSGAWNPHSKGNIVAVAYDATVKGIDVRSLEDAFTIENANLPNVRNLDFNPNVQYMLATCGDDCKVSLWDTRKTAEPLKTLDDHSHWVWSVRFNPIHDQLILSAGSDARLFLNSVASLSSESVPSLDLSAEEAEATSHKKLGDERLEKMEEHEESVYACAWAASDPWVFASLSFDGRLIISRVKRHHKYSILQL